MRVDPSKVIPTSEDTPERWVAFHKALKSWFGRESANAWFLKFWSQRAGSGSTADTHDLREYMEEQGVDISTTWSGRLKDGTMDIVDWFGDTANVLRAIVLGSLILGVGLIAYYVIKSTNKGKSAGEMLQGLPGRRAMPATPQLNFSNTKLIP